MNERRANRPISTPREPVSRRTIISRIVLIVVGLALLAGMLVQFTPNLGGAAQTQTEGATVMTVNGAPVSERELARLRSGNQLFQSSPGGVIGQDLQNLLVDRAIVVNVVSQDAARIRVSSGDVRKYITDLRAQQGWQKDSDYLAGIAGVGYTDATFRDAVREQLQIQRRVEEIQKGTKVSAEEARFFYDLNAANYKNEARVLARQIVLNDRKTADEVAGKLAGGDFAALARQYSKVGADADGALGAKKGEKAPQPVTRVALPGAVADAVFKLPAGGTTPVIADGGKFYITRVEKVLPAGQQTFAEAKTKVEADALQAKQSGAVEAWIEGLQRNAKVEFPQGSPLSFYNPTVATVGQRAITLSQLNSAVYGNPQIAQFIQQGGEQGGSLVTEFFKPQALDNLVNQAVAVQSARASGRPYVGAAGDILAAAQGYAARDAKVSEAEARKYYTDNLSSYTTPAGATVAQATFGTAAAANAFRAAFVASGGDFAKVAAAQKGTVNELGAVNPEGLAPAFAKVVFETPALTKAGGGQVSGVVEQEGKFNVLYVTKQTPQVVQGFEQARADATEKALAAKRAAVGQTWLEGERKKASVANSLDKVNKELAALAAKADAATATGTATGAARTATGTASGTP